MKRSIIYLVLAILFFLGSVTFYINTVVIPKYLKNIIVEEAQEFLGRKITLHSLHFNPLKGFVFNGITVYEENSPDVFATISRAKVQLLYWPLLRQRKIVLSNLNFETASLNLIHYIDGEWNFSDIIERRSKNRRKNSINVFISRLELNDSRLMVTSLEDGAQFSDVFDDLNIHLKFSISKGLTFRASAAIADRKSLFDFNGTFLPVSQKLSMGIKLENFPVNNYYRIIKKDFPVILDDAFINNIQIQLSAAKHLLNIKGLVSLSRLALHSPLLSFKAESFVADELDGSFQDGQITLKGLTSAENVQASYNGNAYSVDKLAVHFDPLTAQGRAIAANGALSASGAVINIPDQLDLKGDIDLKNVRLSQGAQVTSIQASPDFRNVVLKTPTIRMQGHFSSPDLSLTTTPKTTTAKGSLYADALNYQWPGKELTGRVVLSDLRVNGVHGTQWTSQTRINGEEIFIKLSNGKTFQSNIAGTGFFQYLCAPKTFQLKSNYQLTNSRLSITDTMSINASPSGSVTVSSRAGPLEPFPYSGWMDFKGGTLLGTKAGPVDSINGIASFQNDKVETSGISFLALGMPTKITGTLQDFNTPKLDVRIHLDDFDLSMAKKIIPDTFENNQISLTGKALPLDIAYKGDVTTSDGADIRFTAQVKDATAVSEKFQQQLTQLSGQVNYADKTLSWKNLQANFNDQPYVLTGDLNSAESPTIDTTIEGADLKIHARFNHSKEALHFSQLSGRYKTAMVNVSGTSRKTADGKPFLDFSGEVDVDLQDLPSFFPSIPEGIRLCRLAGKTNIKGHFIGNLSHWQDWQYNLTGASPAFSIWGINLKNIKFNAVQKNNLLKPFHVWGDFYGGEMNLVASLDTAKKDLPLDLVIRILNSDLNKLRVDTPFKKQSLDGILSATALLNGPMADLHLMNGKGGVEVKDGLLWEFDLLKGLGGILLIPEYKNIVFTQAGMNFALENGLMSTENIQLVGPTLNLYGKGSLDFNQDQALNLWLTPDFNSDVILKSSSLKKSTTAIITQTEKFMSVNVTGTLAKPQYKVNKSPVKILQKTGGVILENVSQFFQNIF